MLIDVLIIRALVLPSLMLLVGHANWAMPAPLARILPRVRVEPSEEPETTQQRPAAKMMR